MNARTATVLVMEDNPTDVLIMREALANAKLRIDLHVAQDGVEGLEFLRRVGAHANAPRPDLIILDLNMPRIDGHQVLAEMKADHALRDIPVAVLTTSNAQDDVARAYGAHANCFIRKPVDFVRFVDAVKNIEHFWFHVVTLPPARPRPV